MMPSEEATIHPDSQATCAYKSKGGFRRIIHALKYSALGIRAGWRHEAAFRQEVLFGVALMGLIPWVAPSMLHAVLMLSVILLVWCVEMINSAIEALADAVSTESHALLGRAKDFGSAAVLFSLALAAIVWSWGLATAFGLA